MARNLIVKAADYAGLILDVIVIICLGIILLYPGLLLNEFLKGKIEKAFADSNPGYSLIIGDMDYNIFSNRIKLNSIFVSKDDSTFSCSISSAGADGIDWIDYFLKGKISFNTIKGSVIDVRRLTLNLRKSSDKLRIGSLYASVPDSEIAISNMEFRPLFSDDRYFAKSKFRQTRYRLQIPVLKLRGVSFSELLKGSTYKVRHIQIKDASADVLMNKDKPGDKADSVKHMPNEQLKELKDTLNIDSITVSDTRLRYKERVKIGLKPGVLTFSKIYLSAKKIYNHDKAALKTIINVRSVFMNAAEMRLNVSMPLSSREFSVNYSGTISRMDCMRLNQWLEVTEGILVKSGTLEKGSYNIKVNSGQARGEVHVLYKDLNVAAIDKGTKSEKGIDKKLITFLAKTVKIRETNMPDGSGPVKTGEVKYDRKSDDSFIQVIWFALRNGLGDIVGF